MKAIIDMGYSNRNVNISGGHLGKATITSDIFENFDVGIEEIKGLREIGSINVSPGSELNFRFVRKDGWEIKIGTQPYDNKDLVVTRFYRKPNGDIDWNNEQYLTKNGKWEKRPEKSLPNDAIRIPLSVLVSLEDAPI